MDQLPFQKYSKQFKSYMICFGCQTKSVGLIAIISQEVNADLIFCPQG